MNSGRFTGILGSLFIAHLWWRAAGLFPLAPYPVVLEYAQAVPWNLALYAAFFASHSIFASGWMKNRFKRAPQSYRRFYLTLTLLAALATWALVSPMNWPYIWDLPFPARAALWGVQLVGVAGFVWTLGSFDLNEFLGAKPDSPTEPARAPVTAALARGPYALCRHPMYFFGFLAFASPSMPAGRALFAAASVTYILTGSWLEERKLLAEWGESYAAYRAATPWLIPSPRSILRAFRQNV